MQVRGDVLPPPHGTNITVVIVNNEKSKTEQALPHINHTANKAKMLAVQEIRKLQILQRNLLLLML